MLAKYRVGLPRYVALVPPEPVLCSNSNCLARVIDLALPYTLSEKDGDIQVKCPSCGRINHILIEGVARVLPSG